MLNRKETEYLNQIDLRKIELLTEKINELSTRRGNLQHAILTRLSLYKVIRRGACGTNFRKDWRAPVEGPQDT